MDNRVRGWRETDGGMEHFKMAIRMLSVYDKNKRMAGFSTTYIDQVMGGNSFF
jgi:hypothetical protein